SLCDILFVWFFFFFFQAEDGIRDGHVTGVQTCALPISCPPRPWDSGTRRACARWRALTRMTAPQRSQIGGSRRPRRRRPTIPVRSEERRVGKECRSRWSPYQEKKKERKTEKRYRCNTQR